MNLSIELPEIKAIIFDCDGVLVDSEPMSCYALNILFDKYFHIDIGSDYSPVLGKSLYDSISYYFTKFNLDKNDSLFQIIINEKDQVYKELAINKLKAFDGVTQLIQEVKNKLLISVASSGEIDKIIFSLSETDLLKHFEIITSANEVKKGKPEPDLFLLTAGKLKIIPAKCLVIEDSISGIKASKKANMFTVGITNTFSKEKLQQADPDIIISNMIELIELFNL